jgi:transposase
MSMVTETSVGIDYHERGVQVCVMSRDGRVEFNRKVKNDIDAVVEAIGRGRTEVTVVAEACNGSATFLDQLHLRTGWPVRLCHPGYAQRMRANPDKIDKSDGELIADLTRVGYLPEVWLAPAAIRDLRALVRYRAAEIDKG